MPANTTRHSLPYPIGSDVAGQADLQMKALAEALDTKLDISVTPDGAGRRVSNLCSYNEGTNGGAGWLVIQTNVTMTMGHMIALNIKGLTYEPSGHIDSTISFYASGGTISNTEVVNVGSFNHGVQILTRNSDSKVAIAISSGNSTGTWFYPKMVVDGIFGHSTVVDTTVTGWSVTRETSLAAYTNRATPITYRPSAEDTGWITMSLINGWTQYDLPNWPAQYRRKGGIVYIRGLVKAPAAGGAGVIMFTLPVGFRPKANTLRGQIDAASASIQLYIEPDGDIFPQAAVNLSWFSIEDVQFPADL